MKGLKNKMSIKAFCKRGLAVLLACAMVVPSLPAMTVRADENATITIDSSAVSADSYEATGDGGCPVSKAFDGNTSTFWHTNYNDGNAAKVTSTTGSDGVNVHTGNNTLTIPLSDVYTVSSISIMPRQYETPTNGLIVEYKVAFYNSNNELISETGAIEIENHKKAIMENATLDLSAKEYVFAEAVEDVSKVVVTVTKAKGAHISAAEIGLKGTKIEYPTVAIDSSAVSADSYEATGDGGCPVSKAFDGNTSTFWHTNYNDGNAAKVVSTTGADGINVHTGNNTVTIPLPGVLSVKSISIMPRQYATPTNGLIVEYKVAFYNSNNELISETEAIEIENHKKAITENATLDLSAKEYMFAEAVENVSKVVVTVTKAKGAHISAAEIGIKSEEVVVTGISVTEPKNKMNVLGAELDLAGFEIATIYSDGTTQVLTEGYTITGYDKDVLGTQTITVACGEYTQTFDVKVVEAGSAEDPSKDVSLDKITATTGSAQGQSGNEGPLEFAFDGNENTLWHSEWNPEWYGKEACSKHLWVEMAFDEPTVVDAIRYLPRNGNGYITGYQILGKTSADSEWMPLVENGTWERTGAEWKIAKFDAIELTSVRLVATSTYADNGDTNDKFASAIEIRVREGKLPVAESVVVNKAPEKTVYVVGEELDLTGLELLVTYDNGTTKAVTEGYEVSGFDSTTVGTKTVTVTCEGVTTTFDVTVVEIEKTITLKVGEVYTEEVAADVEVTSVDSSVATAITTSEVVDATTALHEYTSGGNFSETAGTAVLTDAEFTFTQNGEYWQINNGDTYMDISNASNYFGTATDLTLVVVDAENGIYRIGLENADSSGNTRYAIFYTENNTFDAWATLDIPSVKDTVKFDLTLLEAQEDISDDDVIPGYKLATSVTSGNQYLISYNLNGNYIVLYPTNGQTNQTKKVGATTKVVENNLTITGVTVGTTNVWVGDKVYEVVVKDVITKGTNWINVALLEASIVNGLSVPMTEDSFSAYKVYVSKDKDATWPENADDYTLVCEGTWADAIGTKSTAFKAIEGVYQICLVATDKEEVVIAEPTISYATAADEYCSGGSLRMDYADTYDKTCLRFVYVFPETMNGLTANTWFWNYATSEAKLADNTKTVDEGRWAAKDGQINSNIVFTNIARKNYADNLYTKLTVTYSDNNGNTLTVYDTVVAERSVNTVANAIKAAYKDSVDESQIAQYNYALGILGELAQ